MSPAKFATQQNNSLLEEQLPCLPTAWTQGSTVEAQLGFVPAPLNLKGAALLNRRQNRESRVIALRRDNTAWF